MTRFAAILTLLLATLASSPALAVKWMHWPTTRGDSASRYISQGFYGDYIGYCCASGTNCRAGCGTHNGYDYAVPTGTPLFAVAPGIVDEIHTTDTRGDYGNAGLYVRIKHDAATVSSLGGDTFYSGYLHMSRIDVAQGQAVDTTTQIGLSGATGGVAAHLHFHLARDQTFCGAPVDPGCPNPPHVQGSVIPGFLAGSACEQRCDGNVENMWLEPAAYGSEPYGGCQGLTYYGMCEGAVLKWCEDGAPKEANCAETDRICALENEEIGYNCLACDAAGLPACNEDGTVYASCAAGIVVEEGCMFGCAQDGCIPEPGGVPDVGGTSDLGGGWAPDASGVPDVGPSGPDMGLSPADAEGPTTPDVIRGEGCCATARQASPASSLVLLALALLGLRRRPRD